MKIKTRKFAPPHSKHSMTESSTPATATTIPLVLTICGLHEIPLALITTQFDAIVSITDPDDGLMENRHVRRRRNTIRRHGAKVLFLAFHDVVEENKAHVMPRPHHVAAIVAFARQLQPGTKVLVHCMAGISRSTAAAVIMLRELGVPYHEALTHIMAVRPQAQPNGLMLNLYDATRRLTPPSSPEHESENNTESAAPALKIQPLVLVDSGNTE